MESSQSLEREGNQITSRKTVETNERTINEPRETITDPNTNLRATNLHGSGRTHYERFKSQGTLEELGKAIDCFEDAVSLTDESDLSLLERLTYLGYACADRYQRLSELVDLEKAIECDSSALALTPDGHPHTPRWHAHLGVSYGDRYRCLGELADLEKAMEYNSHALVLTPDDDPDMPHRHANLGACYTDRYQRLGKLVDLEKAIECHSCALALTPDGHPDISSLHANLAVCNRDRYQRLGELVDLEKAIECDSRALALTPDGHPDMPLRHAYLGVSYRHRYQRLGELADLEKATECNSRALALTPEGHLEISNRHANLGVSYGDRYKRLGDLADLEKAIEYKSRALELTPDGHRDMPLRHANLGVSYGDRYQRLGELADLEKAIEYDSRALELTPNGHPHMSRRYANLGVSYGHRYKRLGELVDLGKAIECDFHALALTPDGHPDISIRYANLAVSYKDRHQRLGQRADLENAIEYESRALALTPNDHPDLPQQYFNHALTLLDCYSHTSDPSHLENASQSFRKATQLPTGAPRDKFQYALEWANSASQYPPLNLLEAYQTAIDLLPQFIWLGASANQRYLDLSTTENLAIKACSAAVRFSDYPRALEWLEHARCVLWNQSVMLRSPLDALRASHPDFATHLQNVADELHTFGLQTHTSKPVVYDTIALEETGRQRRHLAGEYYNLLIQIRQLPGFEDFLRPIKARELMQVARSGPVVIINCHRNQCDALVILPEHNSVEHLTLLTFTEHKAQQARSELETSLKHRRLRQRGFKIKGNLSYEDGMENVLRTLWTDVVKPVLDYLGYIDNISQEQLPHITWCPTGPLSFLPLHAAGDYSQPRSRVFNYAISSYTPTLSALTASAPRSQNPCCRLLAVGQATTPGQTPLPGTSTELAYIKAHLQGQAEYSQLVDAQATTTSVLDAMERNDWVHLACHAHQNVNDPTKSGFFLHDGTLDLASINRRSFKNKGLAFLSACQTATGDERLPDEAIHLASGMLMAGYPSVIATMWSVVDDDAPFIADKVYEQLMKDMKVGGGEAGRALHSAVAGLREKVGEKEFGRWVPYIHIGS
ncbi:unnamed protein product [Rhizoctonia solani]|uniref:CHAT domain-containing protein n=1 Tax=Rhizoctonia solani TaxID=456999 RepID=A0A8H3DTT8_9AGAM|nr:unnamed protein product [Rhizoctonia solani]